MSIELHNNNKKKKQKHIKNTWIVNTHFICLHIMWKSSERNYNNNRK